MGEQRPDFPLFPLGIVAAAARARAAAHLRGALQGDDRRVPRATGASSGSSGQSDDGLQAIGCAMEITEVLERHEDGRPEHPHARHAPVPDPRGALRPRLPGGRDRVPRRPGRAGRRADRRGRPRGLRRASSSRRPTTSPSPRSWSRMTAYEMAATVDFGLDAKQGLLDLRSENARLRLRHPPLPRRGQAAGLHRARAGAGALEREGSLRLSGLARLRRLGPAGGPTPPATSPRGSARGRRSCRASGPRRAGRRRRPPRTPGATYATTDARAGPTSAIEV